jgi:hypothetical protein
MRERRRRTVNNNSPNLTTQIRETRADQIRPATPVPVATSQAARSGTPAKSTPTRGTTTASSCGVLFMRPRNCAVIKGLAVIDEFTPRDRQSANASTFRST